MSLEILATERLLPKSLPGPRSIPLSLLDAQSARFAPTGAIWIFDSSLPSQESLVRNLRESFLATLAHFPHLPGQLHWAPWQRDGDHTSRFGRPMVIFGSGHDPGVEWTVARLRRKASDLAPDAATRCAGNQVWVATDFAQADLLSSQTPLALRDLKTYEGLPSTLVQVTLLDDGAVAVAVKIAHPLSDASSLMTLMQHWAYHCRKSIRPDQVADSDQSFPPAPIFDPQILDARAGGDIDSAHPDAELVAQARALPLHRFDWWETSAESYPPFLAATSNNSKPTDPGLLAAAKQAPAAIPPWKTWDLKAPVSHAVIHFTAAQVDALRSKVQQVAPRASRLDALLAHIWSSINRARGLGDSDEGVFLNMTLAARARVDPPLPDTFLGSPLIMAHVGAKGREAAATSKETAGLLASRIRSCLNEFTPQAMSAVLHSTAHEVSPQRFWQAFLGRNHVLVTAWLRLGIDELDFFGTGLPPRYVHQILPLMDGNLQVMDGRSSKGGMDVSLYLESGAMAQLLNDPSLLSMSHA